MGGEIKGYGCNLFGGGGMTWEQIVEMGLAVGGEMLRAVIFAVAEGLLVVIILWLFITRGTD